MIRDEVKQVEDAFFALGKTLSDATPNSAEKEKIFTEAFMAAKEILDLIPLDARDRGKGIANAMTMAAARVLDATIVYSDELPA